MPHFFFLPLEKKKRKKKKVEIWWGPNFPPNMVMIEVTAKFGAINHFRNRIKNDNDYDDGDNNDDDDDEYGKGGR